MFINFANIRFNCPHCKKKYDDENDEYLKKCENNKSYCTTIKCDCGEKFGMTYNIMGNAVSFKI